MVFKPLGVTCNQLGAAGGFQVFVFHNSFPRPFQTERIAIYFNEAIDEIHARTMFTHPLDAILVEQAQITRLVIADERFDVSPLVIVLSHRHRLLEPKDDFADGFTIFSFGKPSVLLNLSITFHERAVQSIGNRFRVVSILYGSIIVLYFLLAHIIVEIAGRSFHEVNSIGLVHSFRQKVRTENHREKLLILRDILPDGFMQRFTQESLAELRQKLLATIVMIDAVGEPHPLQIDLKSLEILAFAIPLKMQIHRLEHLANAEIVFPVLVKRDVAPPQGCLRKIVNELFLLQGKVFETVQTIPQQLYVGEAFVRIVEFFCLHKKMGYLFFFDFLPRF